MEDGEVQRGLPGSYQQQSRRAIGSLSDLPKGILRTNGEEGKEGPLPVPQRVGIGVHQGPLRETADGAILGRPLMELFSGDR